jgi:hypothetical protein
VDVRALTADDHAWVLALNRQNEIETSPLDEGKLARMIAASFQVTVVDKTAFLIAFDETANYEGQHFAWFRERYRRFVYVDRVVVSHAARGRGLARALYDDLFAAAREAGRTRIACEVNRAPPNPASDAFHAKLGFAEVGQSAPSGGKVVRYMLRELGG